MPSSSDHALWQREQENLKELRAKQPELFAPTGTPSHHPFQQIGMAAPAATMPLGYVKYSPLDFIVEEIAQDGTLIPVDGAATPPSGEGQTVYADLVKVGISTIDAAQRLADALGVQMNAIGYSGIKDALALTSQRVSFRQVDAARVAALSVPSVLLKNIHTGKGVMAVGQLRGNRFTLFIRTPESLNEKTFQETIDSIKTNGILNYYGVQRFGTPRMLSHLFGTHLLRGDVRKAVETYFTQASPFELPHWSQTRARLAAKLGDWKAMYAETEALPYSLRHERAMLQVLMRETGADKWLKAVEAVSDQAKLWCMAYASYLVNLYLTDADAQKRSLPESIPLLLTQDPAAKAFFKPWLEKHGTDKWNEHARKYRFLPIGKQGSVQTKIRPTFHGWKVVPEGVAISFDLIKGAYATTVLGSLFTIAPANPIPVWLKKTDVDTKALLGTGNLTEIKTALGSAIAESMSRKQSDDE